MAYPADPGGVFASDAHRRVLGHLPLPGDAPTKLEALLVRMTPDQPTDFTDIDEIGELLADLEADGHAGNTKAGWKQTKAGLGALNAPVGGAED